MRRHRMPTWPTCDIFAQESPWDRRSAASGVSWRLLLRSPNERALGNYLHQPLGGQQCRHPTRRRAASHPVVRVGVDLFIFAFLLLTERRGRPFHGRTFWGYALLYGIARFIIEIYRGDERGTVFDVLSTSQFLSILVVPLSLVMLLRLGRQGGPKPGRAGIAG